MSEPPDLSVVIVSRDVLQLLAACLESIEIQRNSCVMDVWVVDAGSRDGSAAMVAERFPWVRLIASHENLGFTRGNNWALRVARGRHVLLLNPDTVVAPETLHHLVSYLDQHAEVGIVAPKLIDGEGVVQSSRRRFPAKLTGFVESTFLERWLGRSRLVQSYHCGDRSDDVEQEVDWVTGAAMMVRGSVLRQIGLFDERFFMYSEEVDLCRRVRLAGHKIVFLPSALVVHHEGRSSEQNLLARNLHFHESRFRYYEKYFGRAWSLALRLWIIVHFAFLAIEEGGKLALGSKPALRRSRLSTLRGVLSRQTRALAHAAGAR